MIGRRPLGDYELGGVSGHVNGLGTFVTAVHFPVESHSNNGGYRLQRIPLVPQLSFPRWATNSHLPTTHCRGNGRAAE